MAGLFTWLYQAVFKTLLLVVELDVVPDLLIRQAIRFLLGQRLAQVRERCLQDLLAPAAATAEPSNSFRRVWQQTLPPGSAVVEADLRIALYKCRSTAILSRCLHVFSGLLLS